MTFLSLRVADNNQIGCLSSVQTAVCHLTESPVYWNQSVNRTRCDTFTACSKIPFIHIQCWKRPFCLLPTGETRRTHFGPFMSKSSLQNKSIFYLAASYFDSAKCPVKFFTDRGVAGTTIHSRHLCSFNDDCVLIRF